MADARAYFEASTPGEQTATTTQATTCTLEINVTSGETWYLFWSGLLYSFGDIGEVEFVDVTGSTVLGDQSDEGPTNNEYHSVGGIARYVASSTGTRTFAFKHRAAFGSGTVKTKSVTIFALKKHANDVYAESLAEQQSAGSNSYATVFSISTAGMPAGTYLLLGTAELNADQFIGFRARIEQGGNAYAVLDDQRPDNPLQWKPYCGSKIISHDGTTKTYNLQFCVDDPAFTARIRNKRLMFLYGSGFSAIYTATQDARSFTTLSSYQDHTLLSATTNAVPHFVLAAGITDAETADQQGFCDFQEDGITVAEVNEAPHFGVSFPPSRSVFWHIRKSVLSSGSHSWKLRYKSNGTDDAGLAHANIFVGQLEGAYSLERSEPLMVSDANTSIQTGTRAVTETVALADTDLGTAVMLPTRAEAIALDQTAAGIIEMTATLIEGMVWTDDNAQPSAFTLEHTEPVAITEFGAYVTTHDDLTVTETVDLTETAVAGFPNVFLEHTEFLSVDDVLGTALDSGGFANEPILLNDAAKLIVPSWQRLSDRSGTWTRLGEEVVRTPVDFNDLGTSDASPRGFYAWSAALAESITLASAEGFPAGIDMAVAESMSVFDAPTGNLPYDSAAIEAIELTDANAGDLNLVNGAESIVLTDTGVGTLDIALARAEPITIADSYLEFGGSYTLVVTETIPLADIPNIPLGFTDTRAEPFTIAHVNAASATMLGTVVEGIVLADVVTAPVSTIINVSVSESFTISDTPSDGTFFVFIYPELDTFIYPDGDVFITP